MKDDFPVRIVVAGSRDFSNRKLAYKVLDIVKEKIDKPFEIVSGCARGADSLGEWWAKDNGINVKRFPADWNTYGKRAGYLRNKEMAEYGTHLILFWDGISKGSKHMLDLAEKNDLNVTVIRYDLLGVNRE